MLLLQKSYDNYCAFTLLKERGVTKNENYYTAAVHCAYYSCYQKVIYILQEFYEDRYAAVGISGSGSHKQLITEFVGCLYSSFKGHRKDITQLNRYLTDLKVFRHKSDYQTDIISSNDIGIVQDYLEEIRRIIKETTEL